MRFRTEIEQIKSNVSIGAETPVLMLGSCFTDEIGQQLAADGFKVMHNPMGPLYNPASILNQISHPAYSEADLTPGPRGYHCLDFATKYSGESAAELLETLNGELKALHEFMTLKPVVFITLGSAFVYRHLASDRIVGNCHKFPAGDFERTLLPLAQIKAMLELIIDAFTGCRGVIFTVSPIRHLADGLHGNSISKSFLQTALYEISQVKHEVAVEYFPAYEIMLDDLRDYRFYAEDMKHPSPVAVDYIYERFAQTYFDAKTRATAAENRKKYLASRHRPIL